MKIDFQLNGQARSVDVPEEMPLLWVIRDVVGLTGTKFGCGMALCGSCTVHIDGVATRSCIMPAVAIQGKKIMTIEGLSEKGEHPLQKAWEECAVPQCGYCQCGQIMNAAGLLNQTKHPSKTQIQDSMNGNICRCGTYARIEKAIVRASGGQSHE